MGDSSVNEFHLGDAEAPDLLGVWVASGAERAGAAPEAVWHATFGPDARQANERLASAERRLGSSASRLEDAERRLVSFMRSSSEVVSFDSPTGSTHRHQGTAESNLADLLVATHATSETEFGLGEIVPGSLGTVIRGYQTWLHRTGFALAPIARVETRATNRSVAESVVWAVGSVYTVWSDQLADDQMELHHRTVALVLRSRRELLNTLSLIARGAALLASAASLGPLALPAVWRFVEDVRTEHLRRSGAGQAYVS